MGTVTLAEALNTPANVNLTIKTSADQPLEYTDVVWEDLRFSLTQTRRGASLKPAMDYTNVGLLFEQDAAADKLYIVAQFPHERKLGATVKPHLHWQQASATLPVWKMDYKWVINGEAVPALFTEGIEPSVVETFDYTTGNLAQISQWAALTPPEGDNVSTMLLIKLYRDDSTAPETVLGFEFDIHYQIDTPGSKQEYVK
jgi:hypothetical protein